MVAAAEVVVEGAADVVVVEYVMLANLAPQMPET